MRMQRIAISMAVGLAISAAHAAADASSSRRSAPAGTCAARKAVPAGKKKGNSLDSAVSGFKTKSGKAKAKTTYTLAQVKGLLAHDVKKLTVGALAAMIFVLEMESPKEGATLLAKARQRVIVRKGKQVNTGPEVMSAIEDLRERHGAPCTGIRQRQGATWPPKYDCKEPPVVAKPSGPTPLIAFAKVPVLSVLSGDADQKKEPARESAQQSARRQAELKARDAFTVPGENLGAQPISFCVKNNCYKTYAQVARVLYPGVTGFDRLPVFCVPKQASGKWAADKVHCTGTWLETLNWKPWKADGEPNDPPAEPVIPPYACVGNPHFFGKHVVVPKGAGGGNGFYCRKRIFRVLAQRAEKSFADVNKNIAAMCTEMRQQVWGEKYKDINVQYSKWCQSAKGPKDKTLCPQLKLSATGELEMPPLPFMHLTREEVQVYFGHKEYYCRADRAGLTHFLYNDKWAEKFTCGVDRGLIEAGPFEEGVQLCALSPYVGENAPSGFIADPFKARMHCWMFNRPTCEQVMLDGKERDEQKKLDSIHRSNVFDTFDVLREYRRTRLKKIFSLLDLKDAEKLSGFADVYSYSDNAGDEGTYGVKEFCRFAGNTKTVQCGYDRKQIEHYYELRRNEKPVGCMTGVCARGAFERGFLCGVFKSPELFDGRPYWMCGLDIGLKGRAMLTKATAICLGGKPFQNFLSPKGVAGNLTCFERRFRWGESSESREMLERFDFAKMVEAAIAPVLGDIQRDEVRHTDLLNAAVVISRKDDMPQLVAWIKEHGHTLGHRTSMRIGLTRALKVQAVQDFLKINITSKEILKVDPDVKPDKVERAKTAKAKDVNELISEFRKGERAPDAKWLFEWLKEAVEGGIEHIARNSIVTGIRVSMMFQVLDGARKILQKYAGDYADEVLKKAKLGNPLSRLELHERAREETFEKEGIRGNVYCIPDSLPSMDGATKPSKRYYACGSSPLLAMGLVEHSVRAREVEFDPSGDTAADNAQLLVEFREKLRKQTKSEWCYGGTKDKQVFGGANALSALYGTDLSSPYQLEPPTNALDRNNRTYGVMFHAKSPLIWRNKTNWLKCAGFQYNDENWQKAVANKGASGKSGSGGGGGGGGGGGALMGMVGGMVSGLVGSALGPIANFKKMIDDVINPAGEFLKGWTDQFVDLAKEQWEASRDKIKNAEEALVTKTEELKAAAEQAQTDLDTIKNDTQAALDKLEQDQQNEVDKVRAEAEKSTWDKKEAAYVAEVAAAGAQAAAKAALSQRWSEAKEEAKEAEREAKEKVKTALTAQSDAIKDLVAKNAADVKAAKEKLKEAKKTFEKTVKDETKKLVKLREAEAKVNGTIKNSNKLFEQMIEALVKMAAEHVMQPLSPLVREVFSKAFSWVRRLIGAVAKGLIAAAGSIPFVGGALAALISAALDAALDFIEEKCIEVLLGIVERIVAKIVRAGVSIIQKPMQDGILKQVHSACSQVVDDNGKSVCPPDGEKLKFAALPPEKQWINRALACGRGPVLEPMFAQIREDAIKARQDLHQRIEYMQANTQMIARQFADEYFRKHGTTYNDWMATASIGAGITKVAKLQLQKITDRFNELAERARRTQSEAKAQKAKAAPF